MSKYIIDVGEGYIRHGLERTLTIPVMINNYEDHWMDTRISVTPYTEPDLEQRKEAFEKGYGAALDDLWEAMQKAIKMYCEIDNEVFLRVFHDVKCDWGESVLQALFKNTPQHLIDSIRKYEQRQEEQIHVGDEVDAPFGKAVVLDVTDNAVFYLYAAGGTGWEEPEYVREHKTGRNFPDIASVIEKMREGQEQ